MVPERRVFVGTFPNIIGMFSEIFGEVKGGINIEFTFSSSPLFQWNIYEVA
jgi:hypothetical protein